MSGQDYFGSSDPRIRSRRQQILESKHWCGLCSTNNCCLPPQTDYHYWEEDGEEESISQTLLRLEERVNAKK